MSGLAWERLGVPRGVGGSGREVVGEEGRLDLPAQAAAPRPGAASTAENKTKLRSEKQERTK